MEGINGMSSHMAGFLLFPQSNSHHRPQPFFLFPCPTFSRSTNFTIAKYHRASNISLNIHSYCVFIYLYMTFLVFFIFLASPYSYPMSHMITPLVLKKNHSYH